MNSLSPKAVNKFIFFWFPDIKIFSNFALAKSPAWLYYCFMNFFFQHIEYLLLRHDCVIVPGLGAFIATTTPANFDMGKGMITPPSRAFMFNQAVALDDGLLANSIARKAGISFEDARNAIVRCVAKIKEIINNDGFIKIGSLGYLQLGKENNLLFSPAKTGIASCEELGYGTITLNQESELENEVSDSNEEPNSESGYYLFKISKTFTRIAAMIAVMAFVALTVILNPLPADNREQRASVVPVEKILPPVQAKAMPQEDTPDTTTIDEGTVVKVNETAEQSPIHYLIVATFSNSKEAKAYAEKYSTPEFPLTAVESRKMTRVSVAESDDREEVRMRLNSSAISQRFPNAWIWTRN